MHGTPLAQNTSMYENCNILNREYMDVHNMKFILRVNQDILQEC